MRFDLFVFILTSFFSLRLVPHVCAKVNICVERNIVIIPFPCFVSDVRHFPSPQTAAIL